MNHFQPYPPFQTSNSIRQFRTQRRTQYEPPLVNSTTRNNSKICLACGTPVTCTQMFYCSDCCYCKLCKAFQKTLLPADQPKINFNSAGSPIELGDLQPDSTLDKAIDALEQSSKLLHSEIKKSSLKRSHAQIGDQLLSESKKVKIEDEVNWTTWDSTNPKWHPNYDDQ